MGSIWPEPHHSPRVNAAEFGEVDETGSQGPPGQPVHGESSE